MKQLILTVGLPRSGKTTWTNSALHLMNASVIKYINVNRDDLRKMLMNKDFVAGANEIEYLITQTQENLVKSWFKLPESEGVIISDTNLNPKVRERWKQIAEFCEVEYYEERRFLEVSVDECNARNEISKLKGERYVNPDVINRMRSTYNKEFVNV